MDINELTQHVNRSIILSQLGVSNLNKDIFYLDGMSSPKVRMFLNNVCERAGTKYLEIGCWKGSTLVSALYQNQVFIEKAIAIDNFSEFVEGPPLITNAIITSSDTQDKFRIPRDMSVQDTFRFNLQNFISNSYHESKGPFFYDKDCFSPETIQQIKNEHPEFKANVYFYDGNHEYESQRKAFTVLDCFLDDTFVAIVDDWNDDNARNGTNAAFLELGYEVIQDVALPSRFNGDVANWWQGLYVAIVRKGG